MQCINVKNIYFFYNVHETHVNNVVECREFTVKFSWIGLSWDQLRYQPEAKEGGGGVGGREGGGGEGRCGSMFVNHVTNNITCLTCTTRSRAHTS